MHKILSFFLSQYSLIQTGLSTILLDLHFPPISIKIWFFFFEFENLILWYWGKNTKMDLSQLCKWEGCYSKISIDFVFSFTENGRARMLSTADAKPINLLHPNLSLLRSPLRSSLLLFKTNPWLALLYGVLPTGVWTCCKQNPLTPASLPAAPMSLPSLHGHICRWSLCFHSSHSLLSPPPSGSVMETAPGGHHWPPCCKIQCTLISLSFFNSTSWQHLTADCSRLSFSWRKLPGLSPASLGASFQMSLKMSLYLSWKCWCSPHPEILFFVNTYPPCELMTPLSLSNDDCQICVSSPHLHPGL